MQLRRKRFDRPDEVRTVEKARIELVELGDAAIGHTIFEPGWRWSEHVKPIVGTTTCEVHHLGYVLSGHLHVDMDDGASIDLRTGDVFEVPPGHLAYVVGDEPWRSIDFAGRRLFAKAPEDATERKLATIVFTDLSRSTETASLMGDVRWRTLLADHNQAVRGHIERYQGREEQDDRRRLPRHLRQPGPGRPRRRRDARRRHRPRTHGASGRPHR